MGDNDEKEFQFPDVVELNVGGHVYTTSLTTLTKGDSDMLAVMFSGRHKVSKDKDGRYFIDADGALFSHILRYLRNGALPCASISSQIYREAKYFGLEELQGHIERMPAMMGRQARLQFQEKLTGFDDALESVLKAASEQQCVMSDEVVSYAIISIIKDVQHSSNPCFNKNHVCRVNSSIDSDNILSADLRIGPWKKRQPEVTERVYLRALIRELEWRGFTVTFSKQGQCSYIETTPHRFECYCTVYKFVFHWHKCF